MAWKTIAALALTVFVSGISFAVDDQTAKEKTALTAAQAWLKLIDTEKYDASWQGTAEFFRQKVTREQWIQMMDTGRKGLGVPKTRTKVSSWFRTSMPGAPDGEYFAFQFESTFSNKKTYIETVTPMKEKDGKWRVIGYYIKPKEENKDKVTIPPSESR